jgi:spermidine synthase
MMASALSRRHVLAAAGAGLIGSRAVEAQQLEFNSAYNFVFIERSGSLVTFKYAVNGSRMSSLDLANPPYQVVPYTAYYYAADLVRRNPRQVLMAGLGAGGFNRLFNLVYPASRLVTVEIDPMIRDLAQQHAGFTTGPNNEVAIEDARIFLRRSRETYDWKILDAFDREAQIPVHLTTQEFFATAALRLAEDGVMLTNLHQGTRFFASEVLTIRAVFPEVVLLPVRTRGNVILMAAKTPAPIASRLQQFTAEEQVRYRSYGVDMVAIAADMVPEADYLPVLQEQGMVLTDDFAPVESLDQRPIPPINPGGL